MSDNRLIPRILIIDDVFGRTHPDSRNADRASLCGKYLFEDVTGDEADKGTPQRIKEPLAQVIFCRGQTPKSSIIGDTVENDLEGTLKIVREGWINWLPEKPRWSMILLDLCFYTGEVTRDSDQKQKGMPEGRDSDADPNGYFGLRLLEAIYNEFSDLPVVILSSKPQKEVEKLYNSLGALGFLAREARDGTDRLKGLIDRHGLTPDQTGQIVGHSKALLQALRSARNYAKTDGPVLLRGETGVGKDVIARYIHENSKRKQNIFLPLSLAAIPDSLVESELFGFLKGAFTGANYSKKGLFEMAGGGTVLLDEIGDASPHVQGRLLRVIQNKEIQKIGSEDIQKVDVRILSATNVDVEKMAKAGSSFRSDLAYRIVQAGEILVPALRDRVEDIPLLVEAFFRQMEDKVGSSISHGIDQSAMDELCRHKWSGNVNELKRVVTGALINFPDNEILFPHHFQLKAQTLAIPQPKPKVTHPSAGTDRLPPIGTSGVRTIEDLIDVLASFDFEQLTRDELRGGYPELQTAYALLLSRYLKRACQFHTHDSGRSGEEKVYFHPAMKLITGESCWGAKVSATKAKQMIRKDYNLSKAEEVREYWAGDHTLKTLFERFIKKETGNKK